MNSFPEHPTASGILLPAENLAEQINIGEEVLFKGLSLRNLTKGVLWNMCIRRGLGLPEHPNRDDMVNALNAWVSRSHS